MLVRGVEPGSPAETAGIAEGDLLVAAGGRPVDDVDALHEILREAGLPIELTLVRGTEERTVKVGVPEPDAQDGDVATAEPAGDGPVH